MLMISIKTCTEIEVSELDGNKLPIGKRRSIKVHNHCIYDVLIVLEVDGHTYTIEAKDLQTAIENGVNR